MSEHSVQNSNVEQPGDGPSNGGIARSANSGKINFAEQLGEGPGNGRIAKSATGKQGVKRKTEQKTIETKYEAILEVEKDSDMATQNDEASMPRTFPDWQLDKSLSASILHLYRNKLWTDVTFQCKDHSKEDTEDRIHAHKVVLAARSPVFEAMFYGPCADGKNEVELPTIEADIIDLVIRYVYSDKTDLQENTAPRVMEIAHMYQLTSLVKYCGNFLQTVLRPDNACEILELSLFYDQMDLRDAAYDVIDDNAKQVIESDGFLRVSHSCLIKILKGDTFYAKETDVFNMVEKWAVNSNSNSEKVSNAKMNRELLGQAFTNLRVPTMSVGEFLSCTRRKGYYTIEETEDLLYHIDSQPKDTGTCMVSCHNAARRLPRVKVHVVPTVEHTLTSYVNKIECAILAKVSKDCYIDKLILVEMEPWINFTKDENSDLILNGVFRLQKLNFETAFQLHPRKVNAISLRKPLFVSKNKEPYSIRVNVELRSSFPGVHLKAVSEEVDDGCLNEEHIEECRERLETMARGSRDAVTFSYCCSSKYINCLYGFKVHNISNREDKTTEIRKQPETDTK